MLADAFRRPRPVEDGHVEAIHRAHFAAELSLDDDVGMDAAFALEHDVMVFEIRRVGVNEREVNEVGRVLDDFYDARVHVTLAGVVIVIKRAPAVGVARDGAVQIVREFLSVLDDGRGADVVADVVAEGDFEQAVVEDQILDVRRAVIADGGGLAVQSHCHIPGGGLDTGNKGRRNCQQQKGGKMKLQFFGAIVNGHW